MVVPSKEAKTNGAAGIDAEGGRGPTAVPAPATAAPELLDRPRRRTFTAQTKLRVCGDRRRGRFWWDWSDPAPGRLVLVDPDGLAPAARQRCSWCADAGQAGTQVGGTQPIGSGTGAGQTGECTARAAIGARRGDHRNPKKHSWTAVPPVDVETVSLILAVGGERPSTFWWCIHRKKTWSMGFCGPESGDAYGDPD